MKFVFLARVGLYEFCRRVNDCGAAMQSNHIPARLLRLEDGSLQLLHYLPAPDNGNAGVIRFLIYVIDVEELEVTVEPFYTLVPPTPPLSGLAYIDRFVRTLTRLGDCQMIEIENEFGDRWQRES